MTWECVIGLEVHVQLKTRSKIFSAASAAFGAEPNTQACPVDLGLPGVLPVLNREAVRMAVTFGLAIDATVARRCRFDRKNYFYPDLPKGYQISQLDEPIVGAGSLEITLDDGSTRRIGITRAHLEEDAGKSLHENFAGMTGIDLNRAGTPLLEVVSEPELRSPQEAAAYFREVHALVRYLDICDGNLNEGSMRCDANISVRQSGDTTLGERTEIKNLNSFRFVERALQFEIDRQIDVLESGGTVVRETRLYDSDRHETRPMRSKELSEDYRYFPDPDLLPVEVTDQLISEARAAIPELPNAKRQRFVEAYRLGEYDAAWLTRDPHIAAYFEAVVEVCGDAKRSANWIMGDVSAALNRMAANRTNIEIDDLPVPASQLGTLIARINDKTISSKIAKTLFDLLIGTGGDVDKLIEEQGLRQVSDRDELGTLIASVVADNADQAAQYRAGKTKVLGYFVGQVMQATQGKANPQQVNELLIKALK
ncbi:MAG: Asp-tRNA(Asn)/Glu-tRNA(Gln) amidotransferase subunit GatB [Gammaproteobacteria bacterium]|nr:Asp-tRNA(Asn)/Glu-tRNA(Gln) amidotransferase subunit GatB [Gammaproteobacteria bacterium]